MILENLGWIVAAGYWGWTLRRWQEDARPAPEPLTDWERKLGTQLAAEIERVRFNKRMIGEGGRAFYVARAQRQGAPDVYLIIQSEEPANVLA